MDFYLWEKEKMGLVFHFEGSRNIMGCPQLSDSINDILDIY